MTVKKLANTFCVAPWFQIRNENPGELKPCCVIDTDRSQFSGPKDYNIRQHTVKEWLDSDYLKHLRNRLTDGERLPECHACWTCEDRGLVSERQTLNNTLTKNRGHELDGTWIPVFLKQADPARHMQILSADIKHSNLCNFSCVMCRPADSTQLLTRWRKNSHHPMIRKLSGGPEYFQEIEQIYRSDINTRYLDEILALEPRYLKILGGEPLIDPVLMTKLINIPDRVKSRTTVHFITNGSVDLVATRDKLGAFQHMSFSVSLEGIGHIQDQIRSGSNWPQIERNLLGAKQAGINLYLHHVLQAQSFSLLYQLLEWTLQHDFAIDFAVLSEPRHLSLDALPDLDFDAAVSDLRLRFGNTSWRSGENGTISLENILALTSHRCYNRELTEDLRSHWDLHRAMTS